MMPPTPWLDAAQDALALTILHFAWQGFALWVLALCVLHVVREATPQVRYAALCGLLTLIAICPLVTFGLVFQRPALSASVDLPAATMPVADGSNPMIEHQPRPTSWGSAAATLTAGLRGRQGWLVAIWFTGTALFALRLVLAVIGVAAIRRRRRSLPPEFAGIVDRLQAKLAFRRRPSVYVVQHLSQAMAVGLLKPLVLLPASWLSELPPQVIEAVVAHELAHLRRWDLLINLVQRVIECVLFFHPVVWWCSRRLRVEREICCDALAVRASGNRVQYAKALTFLADQRIAGIEPLLAAGIGGPKMVLLERIRRVLDLATPKRRPFYGATCAAAGAGAASILWLAGVAVVHAYSRTAPLDETRTAVAAPTIAPPLAVPPDKPDGTVAEEQTWRFMFGAGVRPARYEVVPNEQNMTTLPPYTIGPPDILFIDAARVEHKRPYRLRAGDVFKIRALGVDLSGATRDRLNGDWYRVDSNGRIDLGKRFGGPVKISGRTLEQAAAVIQDALAKHAEIADVSLVLGATSAHLQPVSGEHLVNPDGTVNLGTYGHVYIAGMTVAQAKQAVDRHLGEKLEDPDVTVRVFAYNSKVYYVLTEGADKGDTAARFPITGNETVLDALTQVVGLKRVSTKKIWIARPKPGGSASDTILPVDWEAITRGVSTATNYQILPGDRIFISNEDPPAPPSAQNKGPNPPHADAHSNVGHREWPLGLPPANRDLISDQISPAKSAAQETY